MTPYALGFLTKCAESGTPIERAVELLSRMTRSISSLGDRGERGKSHKGGISGKTYKRIGLGMAATGTAIPLALMLRAKGLSDKAFRVMMADAAKYHGVGEVSNAIYEHMARTGAKLPKHKFVDFYMKLLSRHPRTSMNGAVPILKDGDKFLEVMLPRERKDAKFLDRLKHKILKKLTELQLAGPAYIGGHDFIHSGSGKGRMLSPKALLHELGHAADYENLATFTKPGARNKNPYALTMKELLFAMFNPEATGPYRMEQRAWDNAMVPKGDEAREAALATYRNGMRLAGSIGIGRPVLGLGGLATSIYGRKLEKDGR